MRVCIRSVAFVTHLGPFFRCGKPNYRMQWRAGTEFFFVATKENPRIGHFPLCLMCAQEGWLFIIIGDLNTEPFKSDEMAIVNGD